MKNKNYLVTSTVNIPYFLEDILKNSRKYKRDFVGVVIGDKKTPNDAKNYCKMLNKKYKSDIRYFDIFDQNKILKNYSKILKFIPYNNNVRKMIGTFISYLDGCEKLIMIDDDNFPISKVDFFKYHEIVGTKRTVKTISSNSKWVNIANMMVEKNNIPFYPRGFPWSKRFKQDSFKESKKKIHILVNGGLVLGDPDVDAVSRLFWPLDVLKIKKNFMPFFAINKNNFCPFNDQNTSLAREIVPIYYKPPSVLRNADIWTSYFIEKICYSNNKYVSFGMPLVNQFRNVHDFRKDYELENIHNKATDLFVDILNKIELKFKKNYIETSKVLIEKCLLEIEKVKFNQNLFNKNAARHAHMPSLKNMQANFQENKHLIRSFFIEYKNWINILSFYINDN